MHLIDKKELINVLIKKLEKIRDTHEIEDFEVIPIEEVESFECLDGTAYAILQTTINIRSRKTYLKGDIFDDFIYKEVK